MPCSQPGPAKQVVVSPWQGGQKPSTPGAPYKVGQQCTSGGYANVTVAWNPASGAKYYELWHVSGEQKAFSVGPSVTVENVPTYPPYGADWTLYVKACNEYGCTQGPSATLKIDPCGGQGQPPPWLNSYYCSIWKGTWMGPPGNEYCYAPHPSPSDVGLSSLEQVYVVQDLNNIHIQASKLLAQGYTWDDPQLQALAQQALWIRQEAASRGLGYLVTEGGQTYIVMNGQKY